MEAENAKTLELLTRYFNDEEMTTEELKQLDRDLRENLIYIGLVLNSR